MQKERSQRNESNRAVRKIIDAVHCGGIPALPQQFHQTVVVGLQIEIQKVGCNALDSGHDKAIGSRMLLTNMKEIGSDVPPVLIEEGKFGIDISSLIER